MKISKAVSTALLAVAAIGASAGSFAATDPTSGQTDLFVAVWNPSTSTSYVQDLGVSYSTLGSSFNTAGYSNSWTVDGGALASTLGAGTYQYQLFAADYFTSSGTYQGNTAYLSLVGGASIPKTISDGELVNGAIGPNGSITNYIKAYMPGTSVVGTGSSYWALSPNGPGYTDSFSMNSLVNLGGTSVGSPLNLIYYVAGSNNGDTASSMVTGSAAGSSSNRGVFNLNSATGQLTYSVASSTPTVPLPPAGWLLISGMLGLVAVSRRRNAEAL